MVSSGVRGVAKSLPTVGNFRHVLTGGISNAVGNTTEANDTLASTATNLDRGATSVTEAADAVSSAAQVIIHGSFSKTEAADTVSSAATNVDHASAAVLEANDTQVSAGVVIVHGNAVPFDIDAILSAGHVLNTGAASIHEAGDSISSASVPPQSLGIVHFYPVTGLYITEDKTAGYVDSQDENTYYKQE